VTVAGAERVRADMAGPVSQAPDATPAAKRVIDSGIEALREAEIFLVVVHHLAPSLRFLRRAPPRNATPLFVGQGLRPSPPIATIFLLNT
jgi:hypothetical protein